MFLSLTNAHPDYQGSKILINSSSVVTVHRSVVETAAGEPEMVTFVHCPPHGTWQVSESVEDITTQLSSGRSIFPNII